MTNSSKWVFRNISLYFFKKTFFKCFSKKKEVKLWQGTFSSQCIHQSNPFFPSLLIHLEARRDQRVATVAHEALSRQCSIFKAQSSPDRSLHVPEKHQQDALWEDTVLVNITARLTIQYLFNCQSLYRWERNKY